MTPLRLLMLVVLNPPRSARSGFSPEGLEGTGQSSFVNFLLTFEKHFSN